MVQREMEKPGSEDKVDCTPEQKISIYRVGANPERERQAASCRPAPVLAPGTRSGRARHGALSSAQVVLHHRPAEPSRATASPRLRLTRPRGPPPCLAAAPHPALRSCSAKITGRTTGQLVRGRDIADRTVQADFVGIRHEVRDDPSCILQTQGCLDANASSLQGPCTTVPSCRCFGIVC